MTKRAIVTVGVSEGGRWFKPYLARFRDSFRRHGEADDVNIWHREFPPGSPRHHEAHYAFKAYAVRDAAMRGFTQILYFDCSCYAVCSIEPLWNRLERDGHVLVEDSIPLGEWSSDHSLNEFEMTREEAMNIPLMCGTCWGLDLSRWKSRTFLKLLLHYATPEHLNGTHVSRQPGAPRPETEGARMSCDPRVKGHRSDEVYSALLAHQLGMKTHVGVEFVGGMPVTEQTCIRSGYDLESTVNDGSQARSRVIHGILDYGDGIDYNV